MGAEDHVFAGQVHIHSQGKSSERDSLPKNVSYLVKVRGCEWVVLPESKDDLLTLALPVVPVVRLTDVLT